VRCVVVEQISKDEEARVKQELEQKLQGINLAMQKMAPNLRATDHFNEVETRLRTTEDEFEDARTRAKEAAERFAAKKQERYDTYVPGLLNTHTHTHTTHHNR
jgi:structural maintenance of chromosome 1